MKKFCLLLFLLSLIFEKLEWVVFGLRLPIYLIVGSLVSLYIIIKKKCIIRIPQSFKRIVFIKCCFFIYILFQFIFINKSISVVDQYTKGCLALILDLIILIGIIVYMTDTNEKFLFSDTIELISIPCIVNVFYNIIQRINPNIDTILVSFFKSTVNRYGLDAYGQLGRLTGLFTDSNNNGVFLAISIVVFIYMIKNEKRNWMKIFYYAISICSLACLVLTFSFTTYIALIIFIIYYFWSYNYKSKVKVIILLFFIVIVLIYVYNNNNDFAGIVYEKISNIHIGSVNTDNSHMLLIQYAINIWMISPSILLIGTGYNCLSYYYEIVYALKSYKAHNYYIQTLVETGVIGLTLLLMYLRELWSLIKKYGTTFDSVFTTKSIIILFVCSNFTYDSMTQPMFLMCLILGISIFNTNKIKYINKKIVDNKII